MNRRNTSGLSLAIHKTMASYTRGKPLVETGNLSEFTIKIANTLEERQAAFELSYQVYLEKGFIRENPNEMLVHQYDSNSDTVILIVQDQFKNVAGTVTVVFDGSAKLPAEKIYRDEIQTLREQGFRMAELSRLVVSPEFRNSKEILVLLFNYAAVYIRHVKRFNGLSIQVNPRHKNYYKSLLNFDEVGGLKPCPQVQNAPAVLLYMTDVKFDYELNKHRNSSGIENKDHSLYQYFLKVEQEKLVAYYLQKQFKPMTAEEKLYFGFTTSGKGQAVAV